MSAQPCILVVDDDPDVAQILKVAFEAEGYRVCAAYGGDEALRKVQEVSPDLAILDIMMPGVDGYKVCQRLREDPETAHLPVLILTGRSRASDQLKAFDCGADDYVTKPASLGEIVDRVRALLYLSVRKVAYPFRPTVP